MNTSPHLTVDIDEFTLVLQPTDKIDCMHWHSQRDKMLEVFLKQSRLEAIFGKMASASKSLPQGYTDALTIADRPFYLMIAWHDFIASIGICVKCSAHAYSAYRQEYEKLYHEEINIVSFLNMVQNDMYVTRFSRIDLVADYFNYPSPRNPSDYLNPNTIYELLKKGSCVIKSIVVTEKGIEEKRSIRTFSAIEKNGVVETFYAGSRKANTRSFMRCYDKRLEQIQNKGTRYQEALACRSWTRFEAVYKNTYAHQLTAQLLQVTSNIELQQLIARHITDKYRFYDVKSNEVTDFTSDLMAYATACQSDALTSPSCRDNTLKQSIDYLKNNSGLFSTLYKVFTVWDSTAERKLLDHLYKVYKDSYKPDAHKNRDIISWKKRHLKELSKQQLEDSF